MNTNIDPRRGATSASNAQADTLCPGRHNAQKGIPQPPASKDAEFGRIIHAALAENAREEVNVGALKSLTGEQRDIFDACREIEKKLIEQFFGGDLTPKRVFREQRYWCLVDKKFEHSAQPDVVVRAGPRGLILEYKTLPGDLPDSPSNLQLRDQVVVASGSLLMNEVGVAIIQPLVTYTPNITLYNATAIKQAEQEMFERVRRSNDPNAPRVAGEIQCKFCLAKSTCPQYASYAPNLLPEVSVLSVPVAQWSPEQRAVFCERRSIAKKWLEECESEMKKLLKADPNAIPGWMLEEGNFRETVKDPQTLFTRFNALGGTLEDFMKCVKIGNGDLEDQVRAVAKLKGKGLKDKVKELLVGLTESKQDAPSLARKKE